MHTILGITRAVIAPLQYSMPFSNATLKRLTTPAKEVRVTATGVSRQNSIASPRCLPSEYRVLACWATYSRALHAAVEVLQARFLRRR